MQIIKSSVISCPYCGESFDITVDMSAGGQNYIEDCSVCCRPVNIYIHTDEQGELLSIEAKHENE